MSKRARDRGETSIRPHLLHELLAYEESSGLFTWRERGMEHFNTKRDRDAWNTRFSGRKAGRPKNGYWCIRILGMDIDAHRVAWAMTNGAWPKGHIDHINGEKQFNAIANLRDVSPQENFQNVIRKRSTKSGLPLGVFMEPKSKKNPFRTSIKIDKKTMHLGCYPSAQEAHEAYIAAKRKYHPGCTL